MKITTIIITILSIFVINTCKACMCSSLKTITFQYQQADFVATVKIIKNYKNSQ
ncbi:hypothetical protein [Pedobacter changchengzhani]|uniref:hypothetical protein n=1 Tax=Pedobacter changchengzhani TaxID=2529274 RepID=UPI001404BCFE|nr:hypothetical protein [Pedobacter changchengzhani]